MNIIEYSLRASAVLIITMVYSTVFLFHRLFGRSRDITYKYSRSWCRNLLSLAGVNIVVEGRENCSKDVSYIFVSNHASMFNIPTLFVALPGNVRIMYKKELERVPFMGWVLKRSSFVPIIREKARDAMLTVQRTIDIIRNDASSLIVFAEGTRTPDGHIQKFKRGAFILAIKSEKPIVPVCIIDSFKILPRDTTRFNKGTIRVRIGTPMVIEHREYSREEEVALMNNVRDEVLKLSNESERGGLAQ